MAEKVASKVASRAASVKPASKAATAKPASKAASKSASAKPASKAASAKPASKAASAKPASKSGPKVASAADSDPTVRGMKDPWFTLVMTGAKTRHVAWAEPKPGMAGRPALPGFENIAVGDTITWRNSNLGFPRECKVTVTKVLFTTTTDVLKKVMVPTMMKAVFPTLTDEEQVKTALAGMAKSEIEKKVVLFEFKSA